MKSDGDYGWVAVLIVFIILLGVITLNHQQGDNTNKPDIPNCSMPVEGGRGGTC